MYSPIWRMFLFQASLATALLNSPSIAAARAQSGIAETERLVCLQLASKDRPLVSWYFLLFHQMVFKIFILVCPIGYLYFFVKCYIFTFLHRVPISTASALSTKPNSPPALFMLYFFIFHVLNIWKHFKLKFFVFLGSRLLQHRSAALLPMRPLSERSDRKRNLLFRRRRVRSGKFGFVFLIVIVNSI